MTQLCTLPAHWPAVQAGGARRLLSGPDEHQAAGWRLQAYRDLEDQAASLALQRVTQASIRRAQVLDRHTLALQPLRWQARGQHERAVGFAFIGEEVERRADEVGSHPAMRHIAHEARLAQARDPPLRPIGSSQAAAGRQKRSRAAPARAGATRDARMSPPCAAHRVCNRPTESHHPAVRRMLASTARTLTAADPAANGPALQRGRERSSLRWRRNRPALRSPASMRCRALLCWRQAKRTNHARNSSRCRARRVAAS